MAPACLAGREEQRHARRCLSMRKHWQRGTNLHVPPRHKTSHTRKSYTYTHTHTNTQTHKHTNTHKQKKPPYICHSSMKTHLDRISQRRARAVHLQGLYILWSDMCVRERLSDDLLLSRTIGCSEAAAATVLVDCSALQPGKWRVWMSAGRGQGSEEQHANSLCSDIAIRRSIQRPTAAHRRQHARTLRTQQSNSSGLRVSAWPVYNAMVQPCALRCMHASTNGLSPKCSTKVQTCWTACVCQYEPGTWRECQGVGRGLLPLPNSACMKATHRSA